MASKLYFGYGSNLSRVQMEERCPGSKYIGIGVLRDWRWIISSRRVANVVPFAGGIIYGMLYTLTPANEARLDTSEGVSAGSYMKQIHGIQGPNSVISDRDYIPALVYVDVNYVEEGSPREEYIPRMNTAIVDALKHGIPEEYVRDTMRRFIPKGEGN